MMKIKHLVLVALVALLAVAAAPGRARADDEEAAAEPVTAPGFNADDSAALEEGSEKFQFESDVSRLMSLIVHSLYSDRDIFLREVISNSADALDKIRFASLTDKSVLEAKEELEIRVSVDKKAKTVTIRDTGVGMTKADLKNYLGVVASSGTTAFLDAASQGEDALKLIGQFGVGFYSVFLVADRVSVASKHNDDEQHVWMSRADSDFTISRDPRGNTLGRGTEITLHIKEDAEEYLDQSKLEQILQRYSQFIAFPILLEKVETVDKEVPVDSDETGVEAEPLPPGVGDDFDDDNLEGIEAEVAARERAAPDDEPLPEDGPAGDDDLDDDLEVEDEEDAPKKEAAPKTKTIQVEERKWEQMNAVKAIWTRRADDVTEEEYADFYKALTKDYTGPLAHNHFAAEGEISFKSLLFVPERADPQLWDKYHEKSKGLKLYVRRVLIADEFSDLLPSYLKFIKGVVDSDDLPLNVSRETLSKSRVLRVMGKKLTRKALDMLRRMAEAAEEYLDEKEAEKEEKKDAEEKDEDADADADAEGEEEDAEAKKEKEEKEKEAGKYATFWKEFGKAVKLGVIEDTANKNKLTKLLRFPTTKSEEEPISLQRYVDRMPEEQQYIYYITGENLDSVRGSPFLERLNAKGFEVVFMVDPLDEYVMSNMQDFDGKKFMSVSKEGFKLDDSADAKNLEKRVKKNYAKFVDWLKEVFEDKIEKVVVSNRIDKSPCVLVTSQYGWSANMERIMKAQTFGDAERNKYMVAKKTLEINPRHPLIRELKARSEEDADSEEVRDLAHLMFDAALVNSGFQMENSVDFAERIHRVMSGSLNVPADAKPASDEEIAGPAEEEEAEDDAEDAEETENLDDSDFDLGDFADAGDADADAADHDEL